MTCRQRKLPDGTVTEGDYRLLVGVNAPDVLSGQAQPQGDTVLAAPIEVQTGLKILRISEVDSPNENYTVLASLRMDWTDPAPGLQSGLLQLLREAVQRQGS